MEIKIKPYKSVKGEISAPGDKSISHRAIMLSAISRGKTRVTNFLTGADCLATIDCFKKLGAQIDVGKKQITIEGKGLYGLKEYGGELYAANSGTTARLICGILSGQNFKSVISGDDSLKSRPMNRIIKPLRLMGARVEAREDNYCPITISGGALKGIEYTLPVASAQVKSCLLLAGLYAEGETVVRESLPSRNHTELMLKALGADISLESGAATVRGGGELNSIESITVPGDISSAAYFIVLALISKGGEILIKNVGVNPTRSGIIEVLKKMGGHIELLNESFDGAEPRCDIYAKASRLKGAEVSGEIIPRIIDEIPILSVAAAYAEGVTVIRGAQELKFKESDRLEAIASEIGKCGAFITKTDDGLIIEGTEDIKGAVYNSRGDHRIAMSAAVAAAFARGESSISNAGCVGISFPEFFNIFKGVLI
jgi:3-phosphoshikimate 1-carboxyvinyltransferase